MFCFVFILSVCWKKRNITAARYLAFWNPLAKHPGSRALPRFAELDPPGNSGVLSHLLEVQLLGS